MEPLTPVPSLSDNRKGAAWQDLANQDRLPPLGHTSTLPGSRAARGVAAKEAFVPTSSPTGRWKPLGRKLDLAPGEAAEEQLRAGSVREEKSRASCSSTITITTAYITFIAHAPKNSPTHPVFHCHCQNSGKSPGGPKIGQPGPTHTIANICHLGAQTGQAQPIAATTRTQRLVYLDPNEDTEWNEILRDFGILPPKEEPKDEIEEMVLRLQKEAMVKPYEKMTLAQLKEAEDEFDEEDMRAIEIYREKRLQEWKSLTKKQKFGELREISGNQYVNEVTNAEKDVWVIIHLYRSSIPMCLLVNQHLSLLARKFPETKFVKAIVNSCIQHYHDHCLPTIFVYKNGQIEGKFIGIIECGGINLKLEELEWKLAEVGAIQTDLEENPKKDIVDMMVSSIRNTSIYDDSSSNSDNDTK
ncbi:phosducin-like protein 2 [Nycticebus coucang]|uniref:phosducin-like protein 2 n=1 Tax=Nycticebus coucang TaxID=9470 RepID=UPI00234C099B|nr:phosducin-like protein 2 [Nycticebus coucang]